MWRGLVGQNTLRHTLRKWGAEVIRALLIFTAAMVAFIVGGTMITQTPLEAVAWLVLLVEVVPIATFAIALQLRKMMRPKSRGDWQHLSADHVDRLPTPRAVAEIVAPQVPQLETPRRELTTWHNGD